MRPLSFKIGLLLVLIPAAAAFAADEQQDDKSYLPPASLIAAPGTAPAANSARATNVRHARVVHRRHEARHNPYWRGYAQPRFGFFPF